jgi:hypothetical protein
MIQSDKLNFIREKCIATNKEKFCGRARCSGEKCLNATIRLADVLLAMEQSRKRDGSEWLVMFTGEFRYVNVLHHSLERHPKWNLRADDLREQSEETINFLYELLK